MRVMVLVKATEDSEKGFFPTPETMKMMAAGSAAFAGKPGTRLTTPRANPSIIKSRKIASTNGAAPLVIDGPLVAQAAGFLVGGLSRGIGCLVVGLGGSEGGGCARDQQRRRDEDHCSHGLARDGAHGRAPGPEIGSPLLT